MTTKASVDDSVIERRLRPIYDWLDNGNNKKAVQEADKVLRKQPNLLCAKVLKALALLRIGKNEDCLALIDSVVSEGTSDDATLQALTICYRELHQPEQICLIYEKAAKLDPNNEEIISHLFMAHVRVGDYRKQQQTAMQLYKLKPKNPYYFWAVMSIVMQSQITCDKTAQNISLQLAERMVYKFVNEDKIDTEAEVLTYLYILETQQKYAEALAVLEGPLAKKIVQQPHNFLLNKKASYNFELKRFGVSSAIYRDLIQQEPDNWQHYLNVTKVALCLYGEVASDSHEDPLGETSKFLKSQKDEFVKYRCPSLGLLQLALALKGKGLKSKIQELCGSPSDHLSFYIKNYGDKTCCYGDIVNFLPLIEKEEISSFLKKVEDFVHLNEKSLPVDINNIYRHQLWLQLSRTFGVHDSFSVGDHLDFGDRMIFFYEGTAHLSLDMAPTDIRPNDTYLILSAHGYLAGLTHQISNLSSQKESLGIMKTFIKMCSLLERGINISKANFQLKLLLIKAYNLIGATGVSYTVYEKLDLKHIQLDTLGHILMFQALDTARHTLANVIFSNTLKFFMANYKDTSDPLIMSYKFGSLVRIPEFVEFRNRLNNSLHFSTVTLEQMLLELTTRANSAKELKEVINQLEVDPAKDKTDWANLRDNRDLHVMNSWDPEERRLSPQLKSETLAADVSLLKIRSLSLRLLVAACQMSEPEFQKHFKDDSDKMLNGASNGNCDNIFSDLVKQLREEQQICDKYVKLKPPFIPLQGPDIPRIYYYSKAHYTSCFLKQLELLLNVYNCTEGCEGLEFWSKSCMEEALKSTELFITDHATYLHSLETAPTRAAFNREPLVQLWHFVETLGFMVIVLSCCHSLLVPIKANLSKRNKKKKGNVLLPDIVVNFNEYVNQLIEKLEKFECELRSKSERCKIEMENNIKENYSLTSICLSSESLDDASESLNKSSESLNKSYESTIVPSDPSAEFSQLRISQCEKLDASCEPSILPNLDLKTVCESIEESLCSSLATLFELFKSKLEFLIKLKL